MATIRSKDAAVFLDLLVCLLVSYVQQIRTSQINMLMGALDTELRFRDRQRSEGWEGTQDDTE